MYDWNMYKDLDLDSFGVRSTRFHSKVLLTDKVQIETVNQISHYSSSIKQILSEANY